MGGTSYLQSYTLCARTHRFNQDMFDITRSSDHLAHLSRVTLKKKKLIFILKCFIVYYFRYKGLVQQTLLKQNMWHFLFQDGINLELN